MMLRLLLNRLQKPQQPRIRVRQSHRYKRNIVLIHEIDLILESVVEVRLFIVSFPT